VDRLDDLVGHRVALRHRLPSGLLTDAVGELTAHDGALTVHTRRGPVRVARPDVVAVRAIPPPVPRRASWAAVAGLENVCADAWPARVDRALGAWRLRAAGGFTGRANAALAVGDPGLPVPSALEVVHSFAAEQGVPPRVHVRLTELGESPGPDGASEDRRPVDGTRQERRPGRPNDDHPGPPVAVTTRPDDAWWALALGRAPTDDERWVLDPTGNGLRTAFGLAPGAGVIRAAVVGDHLHLSRLAVVPDARRTGVGTRLTAAAAAWGREQGARWAVLQVALHQTAARAFYNALGATEHHRYRYLVPPHVR